MVKYVANSYNSLLKGWYLLMMTRYFVFFRNSQTLRIILKSWFGKWYKLNHHVH